MPEHKKAFENEARKNIVYTRIYASNKFADWLLARRILQENMRSTAFFKLYKICILLHRCNLKNFAKNRFEKSAIFVKFQQKIANFWRARSRLYQNEILQEICVWRHFSSSTSVASFCTAAISKFPQKIGLKIQQILWKFSNNFANVAKFAKCCQISKISAW